MSVNCFPSAEQEQVWDAHKQECYRAWRSARMKKATVWLKTQRNLGESLSRIQKKYGKRFVEDLRKGLANEATGRRE